MTVLFLKELSVELMVTLGISSTVSEGIIIIQYERWL